MGIEPTYPSEKYGYIIPESGERVSNNNHKIGSIYKTWLKEQSLIFMSDDIQTIEKYGKNT